MCIRDRLETFLFQYTESEQRHLREQPPQLSPRYRNIPKVVYNGREMYQFLSLIHISTT